MAPRDMLWQPQRSQFARADVLIKHTTMPQSARYRRVWPLALPDIVPPNISRQALTRLTSVVQSVS